MLTTNSWPRIQNRILLFGGSGSGKTNALLKLINHQPDTDKIFLYAKDPYESKYHYLKKKAFRGWPKAFQRPKGSH